MCAAKNKNGEEIYEYILIYVNNFLVILSDCKFMIAVQSVPYKLKDVGPPSQYLSATVGQEKPDGCNKFCWTLLSKESFINAIKTVKENMVLKSAKKCKTPLKTEYRLEIDIMSLLTD